MDLKLLFVSKRQYGYLTDYFRFYNLINPSWNGFEAYFFCTDEGKERYSDPFGKVNYVPSTKDFHKELISYLNNNDYDVIIGAYYRGLTWMSRRERKKLVLDIRTCSTDSNPYRRFAKDLFMKAELTRVKHKSILSHSLASKLGLKDYHYLPLGGDMINYGNRIEKSLTLLYVGVIRDGLQLMVRGFDKFASNTNVEANFIIIGDGKPYYVKQMLDEIASSINNKRINYKGYVKYSELEKYYRMANVGVAYIPQREYFEMQPATKTYEYLLAGMPCIATATFENRQIINNENGVLCDDHPDSFAKALEHLWENRKIFDPDKIRNKMSEYTWRNILIKRLYPILTSVCGQSQKK